MKYEGSSFDWQGNHGVSEASILQLSPGMEETRLQVTVPGAGDVQFNLDRREIRMGSVVAWHYISDDSGFSVTVFND